MEFKQYN